MSTRSTTNDSQTTAAAPCACGRTRRDFLRGLGLTAGALGLFSLSYVRPRADIPQDCKPVPTPPANPIPFTPDTSLAVRTRRSAFRLTASEQTRLKAAYQKLRQLRQTDPNDPRGWMLQANVHCFYCGGASGTMQPEIHGGWWFFPWHRAYLYFHERILASLVGDPTFALPYWDWDTVTGGTLSRSTLPPPYTSPNNSTNALFDANRGVTPTNKIPSQYIDATTMKKRMNSPDFATFGGTDPSGPNPTGGKIEYGPHGAVHVWAGDVNMDWDHPKPDMGVLQTAAQDPVFFSHHCNIDRLWDVWNRSASTHTNPDASTGWPAQSWNFYDENKKWRSIKVSDVTNTENSLRYKYQTPTGLALSVMPHFTLAQKREILTRVEIAQPAEPIKLGTEPQTQKVQLPADMRTRALSVRQGVNEKKRRYLLHIEDIEVPPHKSAIVRVFANLPGANAATPVDSPNFLDYFVIVAKSTTPGEHRHQPANIAIDITDNLPTLLRAGRDLSVTLVPVSGARNKPSASNLSYKRLYITEEQ